MFILLSRMSKSEVWNEFMIVAELVLTGGDQVDQLDTGQVAAHEVGVHFGAVHVQIVHPGGLETTHLTRKWFLLAVDSSRIGSINKSDE